MKEPRILLLIQLLQLYFPDGSSPRAYGSTEDGVMCSRKCILLLSHVCYASQASTEGPSSSLIARSIRLTKKGSSDVLRFAEMRDRIKSLEGQLRAAKGHISVAKLKVDLAITAEKFLIEEMKVLGNHLECKDWPEISFLCF